MRTIHSLFEEIKAQHRLYNPVSAEEVTAFEQRLGCKLPTDLGEFYQLSNGASLFKDDINHISQQIYNYHIDHLEHMTRVRIELLGEAGDDDRNAPASWYGICSTNGDYVALDLATVEDSFCLVLDCWHESFGWTGESKIIAQSFTEFLEQLLKSNGEKYWLESNFKHYGYFDYNPDAA